MKQSTKLPWHVGAVARLHIVNDDAFPYVVCIAAEEQDARPEALIQRRGTRSALLTHDEGTSWPDRMGEALAQGSLEGGGVAALAFVTLGDAMACHRRLKQGTGR